MKKRSKFIFAILFVIAFVLSFESCSDLYNISKTDVSFSLTIPKDFLASRNTADYETYKLTINLFKSFNNDLISEIDKKEIYIDLEKDNKIKVVFDSVPIGETIIATAKIVVGETILFSGESNQITINRGVNHLKIDLNPVEYEIELKINQTSIAVEEWEECVTFTATTGFESYSWSCGDQTSDTNSFTINVSDLSVGEHKVNLTATKGTKTYTAETTFTVEAKIIFEEITQSDVEIINESITSTDGFEKLIFRASDGFESYEWSYANITVEDQCLEIDTSKLPVGNYILSLIATKDGVEFSAQVVFKIEAKLSFSIELVKDVEIFIESYDDDSITFKATDDFDAYYWSCEKQTSSEQTFTVSLSDIKSDWPLVKLIAIKNGIEYSSEY